MKYKIEKLFRASTDKNGQPYISSYTGQAQDRINMKFVGLADYVSFFDNGTHKSLKEGDELEGEIVTKGTFKNFKFPSNRPDLNDIYRRLDAIEEKMGLKTPEAPLPEPSEPVIDDILPF